MQNMTAFLLIVVVFAMLALSSERIGEITARFNLPRITGYLLTGIIVGPFALNLITKDALPRLLFVDEVSLGLIAFAAGSELYFPELKGRLRNIGWVALVSVITTLVAGIVTTFLLIDQISFLQTMNLPSQIAVSVLIGALLIARSPSSAIAIINELRAKGPFTQIVMGVIVAIDVIVIIIFAISISIADALITEVPFSAIFFFLLLLEFATAVVAAYVVYRLLDFILARSWHFWIKASLVLFAGFAVFVLSSWLREYSHHTWALEILVEPLLVCTFAGLLVNNRSAFRAEFHKILHDVGPYIYVVFFTLTGASLEIDLLGQVWVFALIFFVVRLVGIGVGSWIGGTIAGEDPRTNRLMWLAFITQAGVALGLAKEVAVEFPEFGSSLATLIIAVVIINQFVGPPIFKYVVTLMGESRVKAQQEGFDGVRDAIIMGLSSQSIALARRLQTHKWQVKIATRKMELGEGLAASDVNIEQVGDFSAESLRSLDMAKADGVIFMLSDQENIEVAEIVYQTFGIENMVANVKERDRLPKLQELGVLSVCRDTAEVNLLDHFVRSPSVAAIVLGDDENQDIIEVVVGDQQLQGKLIRDLSLPLEVLLLSIRRGQETLMIHGYTAVEVGDKVTMMGPPEKLEEVMLLFDA